MSEPHTFARDMDVRPPGFFGESVFPFWLTSFGIPPLPPVDVDDGRTCGKDHDCLYLRYCDLFEMNLAQGLIENNMWTPTSTRISGRAEGCVPTFLYLPAVSD